MEYFWKSSLRWTHGLLWAGSLLFFWIQLSSPPPPLSLSHALSGSPSSLRCAGPSYLISFSQKTELFWSCHKKKSLSFSQDQDLDQPILPSDEWIPGILSLRWDYPPSSRSQFEVNLDPDLHFYPFPTSSHFDLWDTQALTFSDSSFLVAHRLSGQDHLSIWKGQKELTLQKTPHLSLEADLPSNETLLMLVDQPSVLLLRSLKSLHSFFEDEPALDWLIWTYSPASTLPQKLHLRVKHQHTRKIHTFTFSFPHLHPMHLFFDDSQQSWSTYWYEPISGHLFKGTPQTQGLVISENWDLNALFLKASQGVRTWANQDHQLWQPRPTPHLFSPPPSPCLKTTTHTPWQISSTQHSLLFWADQSSVHSPAPLPPKWTWLPTIPLGAYPKDGACILLPTLSSQSSTLSSTSDQSQSVPLHWWIQDQAHRSIKWKPLDLTSSAWRLKGKVQHSLEHQRILPLVVQDTLHGYLNLGEDGSLLWLDAQGQFKPLLWWQRVNRVLNQWTSSPIEKWILVLILLWNAFGGWSFMPRLSILSQIISWSVFISL